MFEPRAIELPKPTRAALARRGTKTLASMTRHLGPVLAHRLVLAHQIDSTGRAREEAERVLTEILGRIPVPG